MRKYVVDHDKAIVFFAYFLAPIK